MGLCFAAATHAVRASERAIDGVMDGWKVIYMRMIRSFIPPVPFLLFCTCFVMVTDGWMDGLFSLFFIIFFFNHLDVCGRHTLWGFLRRSSSGSLLVFFSFLSCIYVYMPIPLFFIAEYLSACFDRSFSAIRSSAFPPNRFCNVCVVTVRYLHIGVDVKPTYVRWLTDQGYGTE